MTTEVKLMEMMSAALSGKPSGTVEPPQTPEEETFYSRQLAFACRFRGLECVKALVDCGVRFKPSKDVWGIDYSLALLDFNSAFKTCYRVLTIPGRSRDAALGDQANITSNDGRYLEEMNKLPIKERARIAEFLCENSSRAGFDPNEMLFYSIMSGSREITEALKKHGAHLTEERIADITENGRSFNWLEFSYMIDSVSNEEFIPVLGGLAAELGGVKIHFTSGVFDGNFYRGNKSHRFFRLDIFKFIMENFNQKKMNKSRIMKAAIDLEKIDCLAVCAENGWLAQPRKRDEMTAYANEKGKTECTAWLLDFKNRTADLKAEREKAEKRQMAALNASPDSVSEMKKIWSYEKLEDGTLVIKRYKGKNTEVKVPEKIGKDTVTAIGEYAFSHSAPRVTRERGKILETITKITLPDTIKVIETGAFYYMSSLKEINIPDSVVKIGDSAFGCCFALTSAELPDSVQEIGAKTFSGCNKLEHVRLPEGLSEITDYMFSGCHSLKEITIPDTVKRIGIWGFRECRTFEEVTLPEGVEEIAREAFANCPGLKKINLPASIKLIKNYRSPAETPFHASTELVAVVEPKSYAEKYCKKNKISFIYAEDKQ